MPFNKTSVGEPGSENLLASLLAGAIIRTMRRIAMPLNKRFNQGTRRQQLSWLRVFVLSFGLLVAFTSWKFTATGPDKRSGDYRPAFIGKPSTDTRSLRPDHITDSLTKNNAYEHHH